MRDAAILTRRRILSVLLLTLFFCMFSFLPKKSSLLPLIQANWKSGLTVALISIPLSIALSIASGAGPIPGIITGIWATLIAAIFGGNNFNVIGAAGALATVLFAATLSAPFGLGASALPLIALATGIIILGIYAIGADRFLYYIPGSVMYGFASGVAVSIAAGELFDATGLSFMERTGTFLGDVALYVQHAGETNFSALITFAVFLAGILLWKRYVKKLPAVIPAAIFGVGFGFLDVHLFHVGLISLGEKFGGISGSLFLPVSWSSFGPVITTANGLSWLFGVAGTVALIGVLETLITAKIADRITRTQSSSRQELLGLALANIGSGIMGGLPATGVFIRTGANIQSGATHRTSSAIAAIATAIIAIIVLPAFVFIPMAVIAAILVNTALGLIEIHRFKEYWKYERVSFCIAILVAVITILKDAGTGVIVGSTLALLFFADSVARGRFDAVFNFDNGEKEEIRGSKILHLPKERTISVLTYSIAGTLGYIDAERHAENLRHALHNPEVKNIIVRLRNLFSLDHEGVTMLAEIAEESRRVGKPLRFSSASKTITDQLRALPNFSENEGDLFSEKTEEALAKLLA